MTECRKRRARPRTTCYKLSQQAAVSAGWFLSTTDTWAGPYFDPQDLHYADRELFGG